MKKLVAICLVMIGFLFSSENGEANIKDPLMVKFSFTPSTISSKEKSTTSIKGLLANINYNVKCTIVTSQENDPVYLNSLKLVLENVKIDNQEASHKSSYYDLFIKEKGVHSLTFDMYSDNPVAPEINLLNASLDDNISTGGCVAESE